MVMASGTIIHRNSTKVDGAVAAWARSRVCRVAMVVAPRYALNRARLMNTEEKDAARPCARPGGKGEMGGRSLLDIACLGHLAGRDLLGAGERLVDRGYAR